MKPENQLSNPFMQVVAAIVAGLLSFAMVAGSAGLSLLALKFLMAQVRGM